ncbi:pseudouridine synthase [Thermodesulfobacteriota bacterium]
MLLRLQKIIAQAGIASRRAAETLISSGKVSVNGVKMTELGTKADSEKDVITVNGQRINSPEKKIYIMMHKPTGYVTTMNDPEGRKIVTDILKDIKERLYPVGRLDFDTSGLLLFTNDGEVTNKLIHPRHEVMKTYRVKVRDHLTKEQLAKLRLENDELGFRAPRSVRVERAVKQRSARPLSKNSWIRITISEGKNRQVRKMIDSIGGTALKLTRISFGKLELDNLKVGEYRPLTEEEVKYLKSL